MCVCLFRVECPLLPDLDAIDLLWAVVLGVLAGVTALIFVSYMRLLRHVCQHFGLVCRVVVARKIGKRSFLFSFATVGALSAANVALGGFTHWCMWDYLTIVPLLE